MESRKRAEGGRESAVGEGTTPEPASGTGGPGMRSKRPGTAPPTTDRRGSALATALIGVALMAAVDEIVFHQILGWHHFYDRSTPAVGLLSDGLLHAGELIAVVGGFFWFADLRRRDGLAPRAAWGGLLLGAGGFQIFDGLVDHKLLRVHQIRYGVDLTGYDLAWNVGGAFLAITGAVLILRAGTRGGGRARASGT